MSKRLGGKYILSLASDRVRSTLVRELAHTLAIPTTSCNSLFISGIKNSPRHVSLYQSWASLEIRQHNVDAAKRLIAKALTLDKRNGSGWLIAANIEERLGNDGLVGLILRRGIECAPTSAELYRALGDLLLQKGDINNVSSEYSGALLSSAYTFLTQYVFLVVCRQGKFWRKELKSTHYMLQRTTR